MPTTQTFDYDSAAEGSPAAREIRELVRYRDLVLLLVARLIKNRYKRSVLGVLWTLLNPLLNMAILAIVFSSIFQSNLSHYPVYLLSALIAWTFFSQTTTYSAGSFLSGGSLLKRIYLPRTAFTVAAVLNGLVNLAISVVPLVLIMIAVGHPLHPTWWFVPIAAVLLAIFALGVALVVSVLALYFADVVEMYQILAQTWFYMTPIIFPAEILPARFQWLIKINPMHYLIDLFRRPIYDGVIPDWTTIVVGAVCSFVMLAVGWWAFTSKANEFAYRI